MSNRKAVREELLKQAGYIQTPHGWMPAPRPKSYRTQTCFTCKLCYRRSLYSDCNNLNCPFCGGAMKEE